jgi:peptidoglycan/LPS O-acetylase OafA/YrhL/lysophospholipase L1-like esterase
VAIVVLYHAGHLRGGFLGVDLFFVLSGYLITTVLLRGGRSGVDLRTFWARRARRLLPAMLVMLAVVVPVYAIGFAAPVELTTLRREGLATIAYVANWQQILSGQTYWSAAFGASPLRHTWSLSVEEQFYLVWPLALVALVARGGVRKVKAGALGGAVAAGGLTIAFAHFGTFSFNALYLSTITRSTGLLAGAALAAWHHEAAGRRARQRASMGLEVAALVAAAVFLTMVVTVGVSEAPLYTWGLAVSAVCGLTMVAAASNQHPGPIIRTLHAPPLVHLGTISYGVYLWSWPIMQMINERHTDLRGWPLVAVQVAVTLVLAEVSWRFLERPILAGAIPAPRSRSVLIGATVAVVAIVLASTVGARAADPTGVDTAGYANATVGGAQKLLLVGDSVPAVLAREGIRPLRDDLGVSVVSRAVPGCILLRDQGEVKGTEGNIRDDVTPCNQGWRDEVQALKPDVVLMMFGQFANDQVRLDGTFRRPCDPEYAAAERTELDAGIDDLTSNGARVVIATAPWSTVDWVTNAGPVLAERMTCLNDIYRSIADERDDVDLVDLAAYVCPSPTECKDSIDGTNLREDTVHFRDDAAELIARWLVPQALNGATPSPQVASATTVPKAPADPYCKKFDAFIEAVDASDDTPVTEVLPRLRSADPAVLNDGAPADIAADLAMVTADWGGYLDALERMPDSPTLAETRAALGPYAEPTVAIVQWLGANC